MYKIGSHYSYAFDTPQLLELSKQAALRIKCISDELNAQPIICYRGFSGVTFATTIVSQLYSLFSLKAINQAYVRKEHELSHGSFVETNFEMFLGRYFLVFVDDFVYTGKTLNTTIESVISELVEFNLLNFSIHPLVFVLTQIDHKFPILGTTLLSKFTNSLLLYKYMYKSRFREILTQIDFTNSLTAKIEGTDYVTLINYSEKEGNPVYVYYDYIRDSIFKSNLNYLNHQTTKLY